MQTRSSPPPFVTGGVRPEYRDGGGGRGGGGGDSGDGVVVGVVAIL